VVTEILDVMGPECRKYYFLRETCEMYDIGTFDRKEHRYNGNLHS